MNKLLTISLLFLILSSCRSNEVENSNNSIIANPKSSLSFIVDSLKISKKSLKILIDKSDYKLSVLSNNKTIKEFPVVFGTNTIDDKLMEGDRRTPEGVFKVRDFYPHKSWSKFIWINYPTKESWNKHRKAKAENLIPNSASIGGEIGIHGVPEGKFNLISDKNNWTWGCISMSNKDVDDLYKIITNNMIIEITK